MEELKGGIVIIGSLFWQDDNEKGDNERAQWRSKFLKWDERIKVKFPTNYHRISKNKETTMGLSKEKIDSGVAYFVPFADNNYLKDKPEFEVIYNAVRVVESEDLKYKPNRIFLAKYDAIIDEAGINDDDTIIKGKILVVCEKFLNFFYDLNIKKKSPKISKSWVITSIGFNKQKLSKKKSIYEKIIKAWGNNIKKNDLRTTKYTETREPFVSYNNGISTKYAQILKNKKYIECNKRGISTGKEIIFANGVNKPRPNSDDLKEKLDDIPVDEAGIFNGIEEWLKPVDNFNLSKLEGYDYFLTCVLPPSLIYKSINEKEVKLDIAKVDLNYDKNRFYFFNNLACGIRTADDFETILNNKTGIIKKFKGNEFKLNNEEYVNIKYQNSFNKLIFQKNNLYLVNVKNDLIVWQTNNKTKRGSYIIFQDDGNLVIYDENEKPNWATDTKSESIKEIQFLYDSIEFYNSNEVVVDKLNVNKSGKFLITKNDEFKYNSGKISDIKEELFNNLTLNQGEFIECGMAKLIFDTKGRLLLYQNDTLVWFTKMINGHHKDDGSQNGYGGKNAKFQDDGNLVIYSDDAKPTWCSKEFVKDTHIKHYLKLSPDADLSIIDYKSNKIWSATHFKIGIAQKQYINYTARPNILSMLYDMYPNNVLEHYIPNLVDKSSFHEKMCAMPINSIYLHSSTEAIFNNNDELMHYNLSENKIVNKHDKNTAKAGDGYTPKIFKNKNDKIEYTDEL